MSKDFSFNHLSSTQFEDFCHDLLVELRFTDVKWRKGTGKSASPADSGRDIEAKKIQIDETDGETSLETWFFECKHFQKGIPPKELQNALSWANAENPDKLVIIASNFLSNPCKGYLKKYTESNKPKYKIKIWERPDLEGLSFDKIKLLKKYKLSQGLDFVEVMHPLHLRYSSKPNANTLNFLFQLLDNYDPKKRDELLLTAGYFFIAPRYKKSVTGKESLRELQVDKVTYETIKEKCYQLKQTIAEPVIVKLFINMVLEWSFHYGNKTALHETIQRNQNVIDFMKEEIEKGTGKKDELEALIKEFQKRIDALPKQTEHYYSLYVDFCKNIISKLLEENILNSIKNIEDYSD